MDIKILTTGGTIDKVYFDANSQFQVGEPALVDLLKEANVSFAYEQESLLKKDSLELTDEDRQLICQAVDACSCQHILITHGTDTMAETAAALSQSISQDKTVVITGSMQPARLKSTDAVFNVGFAIAALQLMPAGVYIAMNGHVFPAGQVRKNLKAQKFETI